MTAVTGQPAYDQVAADLRAKILDGTYPVGDKPLPSTTKLMATYGVSSTVVRAAIGKLRTEGVVAGQPGKGVYVIKEPEPGPGTDTPPTVARVECLEKAFEDLQRRVSNLEAERAGGGQS